jgi:hypothetical protein
VSTYAAPHVAGLRARPATARAAGAAALGVLLAVAVLLRTTELHIGYWVDEGLSVGIASHGLGDIPGLLRQDAAPPLYYLLLHLWMDVFGDRESATRSLSVLFTALTVPAALWAGWSVFGRRAGWLAAAGAAVSPFLTTYAQDTRMYSLAVLLGVLFAASFAHVFAFGRRRWLPLFVASLTLELYTHNWALFLTAASLGALAVCWRASGDRRALVRDALLGYGAAALLFAPWLPTLIFQARHTGAPWTVAPGVLQLVVVPVGVLGGWVAAVALVAGIGRGAVALRGSGRPALAIRSLAAMAVLVPVIGWLASQVSPAWTGRYLALALGPFLLLAAGALARLRRFELAAIAVVAVVWALGAAPALKSNARDVVRGFAGQLRPGDEVISTQPEQLPTVSYYLGVRGLRTATLLGPTADPGVVDWRRGLARLRATSVHGRLEPLLAALPVGGRLLLVRPIISGLGHWIAPWPKAVRINSSRWAQALSEDHRFRLLSSQPPPPLPADPGQHPVQAALYVKVHG